MTSSNQGIFKEKSVGVGDVSGAAQCDVRCESAPSFMGVGRAGSNKLQIREEHFGIKLSIWNYQRFPPLSYSLGMLVMSK